ncbi:hypothetical protein DNL40_04975 [Xylanimonas oleitrophica]|uniref:Uncharacterized protein n=1 Tax=Xylanimonas oleitrophica TaxID=2607479 RepID=A0A2W5XV36_9MICO|nr:hypothetical protein DNL40_04975 [Xylanimonas oleitrophica]
MVRRGRAAAYALMAVLAVVLFLWFSSGVDQRRAAIEARQEERSSRVESTPNPTVTAAGDAVLPALTDVLAPTGEVYGAPFVRVGSSRVVVVSLTVTAPGGSGRVTVQAPEVTLLVGGAEHEPWPADVDERTTSGGGTVGFSASFEPAGVEPGDEVGVRLTLADGTVLEFEDVTVRDARRGAGARPGTG